MKRRFELDVLRIEELGECPFTFTVWANDQLQEPSVNDRVPLPRSGTLSIHICTDEQTVGAVKLPLKLITHNICCWLPLDHPETLTELMEKVAGPRAMVSFTSLELLSPVSEHGSISERSCDDKGMESPTILRRKAGNLESEGVRRSLLELVGSLKANSEMKAEYKSNLMRLERELQTVKLSLAQERTIFHHKLSNVADDRTLELQKLRITVRSQTSDLADINAKYEAALAVLEEERAISRANEAKTAARIEELEKDMAKSLLREQGTIASNALLQQQNVQQQEELAVTREELKSLKSNVWRLTAFSELPCLEATDERVISLQNRLEESERQRASVINDLHQMQEFIDSVESQEASSQLASQKQLIAQLKDEVKRLTEALADAQEEAIRLQTNEELSPLKGLTTQLTELNSRSASEQEELKNTIASQKRTIGKLHEIQEMLKADLQRTQLLLKAKGQTLHSTEIEILNLKSQIDVYNQAWNDCADDTDRALKDFLHSNGYRSSFCRVGDGLYLIGTKKLRLVLKNDKLLVRTGGGFIYFEEYVKSEKADLFSDLKKCQSASSKSFSSNRSSSVGLVPRNVENYLTMQEHRDPEVTLEDDNLCLQSFTLDDSSYRRAGASNQSPKVDLMKPTKSSIGKRNERTPLKAHNVESRTPRRATQKRPFKM